MKGKSKKKKKEKKKKRNEEEEKKKRKKRKEEKKEKKERRGGRGESGASQHSTERFLQGQRVHPATRASLEKVVERLDIEKMANTRTNANKLQAATKSNGDLPQT